MKLILRFRCGAACALVMLHCLCSGVFAEELTYTASFADGTYLTEGRLTHWHDGSAQPSLNNKKLLDADAPVRWLVCNGLPQVAIPEAYVEFAGGDRFPCRVQEYRHGVENWEERLPPHLLVKPLISIDLPGKPSRPCIGIKTDSLTRVVWQRRESQQYRPGTLFFLDGREVSFRALRWSNGAALLLLKEGTRRVPFSETAEIHLPQPDAWNAYFDTVAELTPEGTSRLMQASSTHGLIVTTSFERFGAYAFSHDPSSWHHMLHPAWSLDALWVPHATIRARRFFLPHEVPLTLIEPTRAVQKSMLGGGWGWQSDRNVRGETLRNGGKQFGWGIGMQARTELTYALPAICKSFRSWVGLDEAAGRGGCSRAMLFANSVGGRPLWTSSHLIGSEQMVDSGILALSGPAAGQESIVLVAEMAHSDRPTGADPYDIRDMVDWLEPQLELDPAKLKAELAARQLKLVPAFADWKVTTQPEATLSFRNQIDSSRMIDDANARRKVVAVGASLIASRRWTVTPEQKYLVLALFRFGYGNEPSRVEVRINGLPVSDFQVPELTRDFHPRPYLLPLHHYVGQQIEVQVVHAAPNENGRIEWRSLETASSITPTPWTLLEIVEQKSKSGTHLATEYDGSILASGDPPANETYTIVGNTSLQGITALRLDAIPDPRFPNQGTGRRRDGTFELHEVKLSAAPIEHPEQAVAVPLDQAWSDHEPDASYQARHAIDGNPQSAWTTWPDPNRPHVLVLGPRHDIGMPGGTRLTVTLAFNGEQSSAGRFRLSVCSHPRPVPVELPANILPYKYAGKARILFDEDEAWMSALQGVTTLTPTTDAYSGRMALKIEKDKWHSDRLPEVSIPIRMNPGPGEARYLRWAWKKRGGESIVLEIAHDNTWGPMGDRKFRFQAGSGPEYAGQAVIVDPQLPAEWTVVTRDLATEFGEFTLTGFALTPNDGEFGLFDRILVAPTLDDLDAAQPEPRPN